MSTFYTHGWDIKYLPIILRNPGWVVNVIRVKHISVSFCSTYNPHMRRRDDFSTLAQLYHQLAFRHFERNSLKIKFYLFFQTWENSTKIELRFRAHFSALSLKLALDSRSKSCQHFWDLSSRVLKGCETTLAKDEFRFYVLCLLFPNFEKNYQIPWKCH